MNIVVVYNPHSGSAKSVKELRTLFSKYHISVKKYIAISKRYGNTLKPFVKKNQVIVAIGGDGTISSVASHIVGTEAIFAPLPGGTLNHFTKDAKIPQDFEKAIVNLIKATPSRVDVATVNDILFLNNSSIGFYPTALQTRSYFEKHLGKWPAALIGTLRAFFRYKTYRVTINGQYFDTPFLFVGNNDYRIDRAQPGRKKLDEGVLSGYAAVTKSRWTLISLLGAAFIGQLDKHSNFRGRKLEEVTIHTRRKHVNVSHDGELTKLKQPLHYQVHKGALKILK